MKIIIRDDDLNFFSRPETIKDVYGFCFDNGIRICLGVVPIVKTNEVKDSKIIPKQTPEGMYSISNNKKLCRFLKELSSAGNEICMHGISHTKNEISLFTKDYAAKQLELGRDIIKKAGNTDVKTYIPPFGRISHQGLNFVCKKGMNISYSLHSHYKVPLPFKFLYRKNIIRLNGCLVFLSDEHLFGYRLNRFKNPKRCLEYAKRRFLLFEKLNKPLIIVNHYWDFDESMVDYWNKFIEWLIEKENVEFMTFKEYK